MIERCEPLVPRCCQFVFLQATAIRILSIRVCNSNKRIATINTERIDNGDMGTVMTVQESYMFASNYLSNSAYAGTLGRMLLPQLSNRDYRKINPNDRWRF